jgi:hypothetical protein
VCLGIIFRTEPKTCLSRLAALDPGCVKTFFSDRYSKPDWKSRFYAKSTSANVPINFRFNVDAHTSILATRFYTLWVESRRLQVSSTNLMQAGWKCRLFTWSGDLLISVARPEIRLGSDVP